MKKTNLFNGLLDYKPEKEKKINLKTPKVSAGSGKIKSFSRNKQKNLKQTKVKEPHFNPMKSGFQIMNAAKHESGWM